MKALVTTAVTIGLIGLMGWAGTPDYVLDVERENERLRAELKRTTIELKRASLASAECQDADLVAAAPELLEALQLGKDFLIGSTAWTQAQVDELTEKICAAIAKATGEQQ